MKAIMISIQPKWVAKILNGEKTIEIRKTCPQVFKHLKPYEGCSIDVYIYLTKNGGELFDGQATCPYLSGKVVAKFTLNKCREWHNYSWQEITKYGCISDNELREYSKGHKSLYIWHIDNLVIFDKPKELSEFVCACPTEKCCKCKYAKFMCGQIACNKPKLTKAPQSWCYVEVE